MKRFMAVAAVLIICLAAGCSRLSVDDLDGTVWESRKTDADPQIGSVELVLSLHFHDTSHFSLKRTERWIAKKESVRTPLPEDSQVTGQYRVEKDSIRLIWSDGSNLLFTFRDGKIFSPDETRVFTKKH